MKMCNSVVAVDPLFWQQLLHSQLHAVCTISWYAVEATLSGSNLASRLLAWNQGRNPWWNRAREIQEKESLVVSLHTSWRWHWTTIRAPREENSVGKQLCDRIFISNNLRLATRLQSTTLQLGYCLVFGWFESSIDDQIMYTGLVEELWVWMLPIILEAMLVYHSHWKGEHYTKTFRPHLAWLRPQPFILLLVVTPFWSTTTLSTAPQAWHIISSDNIH